MRADRRQLYQLWLNLVSNAVKFVPDDRTPRVRVGADRTEDGWQFSVTDNGVGLSPVAREGIFEPFHRGHDRDAFEGAGVGLAVCRRIVERHGGRIWVESDPGGGSTFHFTLPRTMEASTPRGREVRGSTSADRSTPAPA